jgi:nitroreductase
MFKRAKDVWDVDESQFPDHGSIADKWRFLLQYAVLAPSTRNTQPWAFRLRDDILELRADRNREIAAVDTRGRELIMSCGAALFTLRVALERFDCAARISLFPSFDDADCLARLEMLPDKGVPRELRQLFPSIQSRHTQRMPFDGRPLPDELVRQLKQDALAEDVELHIVAEDADKKAIAKLVAEGDMQQARSGTFRMQMASLFRSNLSKRLDGMPGYSHGLGWLRSLLMPGLIKRGGWGEDIASDDFMAVVYAPCLVVLATKKDSPRAWLASGQALARILLRACNSGVAASFLGQAIEVVELRARLRQLLPGNPQPQLMLRMGYGAEAQATPRRRVRDVLR